MKLIVVVLVAILFGGAISADECKCGGEDKVVGPSFKVHGRINGHNGGWPNRIWVVGTNRYLGIPEFSELPANLDSVYTPEYNEVYGDFVVCPLSRFRSGEMQIVCVTSATHLVTKTYGRDRLNPGDLPGCYGFNAQNPPFSSLDTLCLRPDSTYLRIFTDESGQKYTDSGTWSAKYLNSSGSEEQAELELTDFVSRFPDSSMYRGHFIIMRERHVSSMEPLPTRIPIWVNRSKGQSLITLGDYLHGWVKQGESRR